MNPRPHHLMLGVVLAALLLDGYLIARLHAVRAENDGLHVDLVHTTLQRNALRETAGDLSNLAAAHKDVLASCRYDNARLAAMWAAAVNKPATVADSE